MGVWVPGAWARRGPAEGEGAAPLGVGVRAGRLGGGLGVAAAGEGPPGRGARLRGEGLFRGAAPAGGGSLSAALRRDRDKGGGGGRRRLLCRERVYHPTNAVRAPHRGPQFGAPGRPRGSSGHLEIFKN